MEDPIYTSITLSEANELDDACRRMRHLIHAAYACDEGDLEDGMTEILGAIESHLETIEKVKETAAEAREARRGSR